MHVIRHDDGHMEIVFRTVIVTARPKDDIAYAVRQNPAVLGHEGDEVRLGIALQMRQISAIEVYDSQLSLGRSLPAARMFKINERFVPLRNT